MINIIKGGKDRMKERTVKALVLGRAGIGKTSLARTLDPDTTLFVDLEGGDMALQDWEGDIVPVKTWAELKLLTISLGGPIKNVGEYGDSAYEISKRWLGETDLSKYKNVFFDSLSFASKFCLDILEKEFMKEKNKFAMWNKLGNELIGWLMYIQAMTSHNVFVSCGIADKTDEYGVSSWKALIDGQTTASKIPSILDLVLVMSEYKTEDEKMVRALYTNSVNPFGFPAKDRSGMLKDVEQADLTKLMIKLKGEK